MIDNNNNLIQPLRIYKYNELKKGVWIKDINDNKDFIYGFKFDYYCYILRNQFWTYNAYIYLPLDHPLIKKTVKELDEIIDIHGKLTYISPSEGIYGFDCAQIQLGDIIPIQKLMEKDNDIKFPEGKKYWTLNDCKKELIKLSKQCKLFDDYESIKKIVNKNKNELLDEKYVLNEYNNYNINYLSKILNEKMIIRKQYKKYHKEKIKNIKFRNLFYKKQYY